MTIQQITLSRDVVERALEAIESQHYSNVADKLRAALAQPERAERVAQMQGEIERLKALSVTNILLAIVPGDGSGLEVYAQSVNEIVEALGKLDDERDALQSRVAELEKDAGRLQTQLKEKQNGMGQVLADESRGTLHQWDGNIDVGRSVTEPQEREGVVDTARLDWLDSRCSEGNGRHLACLPGGLRTAIDRARSGEGV